MMRSDAGLHPDQARRHIRKTSLYLATRPLLTQHDRTAIIEAYDVERVLPNIDTNYGDRILRCCSGHCVLLVWAPLTSLSLAGQEHGRTIPLAEIVRVIFLRCKMARDPNFVGRNFLLCLPDCTARLAWS